MKRLAVLVSGTGSNLESIINAKLPVVLVLADRPCPAIGIAKSHNVESVIIDRHEYGYGTRIDWDRAGFTEAIGRALKARNISLIAMAGFMTVLSPSIFSEYKERILNTHPSLLPDFKGAHAVPRALEAVASRPRVLLVNFDGTMVDTVSPSSSNVSTLSAYDRAIKKVLGVQAFELYRKQGGLGNRAPAQVLMDLGVDEPALHKVTDELVSHKLEFLIPEIGRPTADGSIWPKLNPGFLDFWRPAQALVESGHLMVAIVSSGHKEFLLRTFEVHHIEAPKVLITDDDLRDLPGTLPQRRMKPDPLAIQMAADHLGFSDLSGMIYVGDDQEKDGGMARAAGVSFIHFDVNLGLRGAML